ncbi:hypothetical protein FRC09_010467 [Ceratobasidium sp. 395]|nr:hypothetical protein FRC09_010467 [Ceratobasidium sp. 395]
MDGLLAHILHELAFEGDLGSDVTRLRQIISQYYSVHPLTSDRAQNVDDKFCAFIWSWLASQSGVVVGVAPSGAEAVYFPPRTGEAKVAIKGKSKAQPDSAASLSPLPPDEATQPLDVLVTKYGGGLRIAVAPDVCFACITGSHIRPPKLSTNAYAVLQLITRSRREGVSVADISRQSGYDPKTCFYFIKILVDLGHVLKIKVGGAAVNVCVHKSFYDDQCVWKQAAKEEAAEPNFDVGAEAQGEENDENDDASGEYTSNFQFELIDNRHMSNPTVVKTRIERLLRHMPEGLHVYRYLLEAIGFKTSLKKERRVFTHRVTELLKSRFIEKVWAPSNSSSSGRVLCIRLVTNDSIPQDLGSAENGAEDEQDVGAPEGTPVDESTAQNDIDSTSLDQFEGVHATQSIAAQVISMVEQSDTTGMTFAEISKNLHNFDSRSVTNLISRFSSGQPPTHLTHRGLAVTTETFGRERRQRVYSIAGYRKMIEQEGLEDQSVVDPKGSGTWALFEPDDFLADEGEREEWLETFVREALAHGGKKAHAQRSKKGRVNPLDKSGVPVKGRPRNTRVHEPTAEKKQGRPPKRKPDEAEGNNGADQPPATKKRRGRPPKAKATDGLDNAIASPVDDPSMATNTPPEKSTPKRKRPRVKNPIQPDAGVALGEQLSGEAGQGRSNKGATDCLEHNLIEGPSTRINDISLHVSRVC